MELMALFFSLLKFKETVIFNYLFFTFQVLDEIGVDVASQVCISRNIFWIYLFNWCYFYVSCGFKFNLISGQLSAAPKGRIAGKTAEGASRYITVLHPIPRPLPIFPLCKLWKEKFATLASPLHDTATVIYGNWITGIVLYNLQFGAIII